MLLKPCRKREPLLIAGETLIYRLIAVMRANVQDQRVHVVADLVTTLNACDLLKLNINILLFTRK